MHGALVRGSGFRRIIEVMPLIWTRNTRYVVMIPHEGTLEPLFPLWSRDTYSLAREMLEEGLKAVVVAAPEDSPAADLVGGAGLRDLPYETGEVVHRDGAVYCDLWIKKK